VEAECVISPQLNYIYDIRCAEFENISQSPIASIQFKNEDLLSVKIIEGKIL
jgi:hypothetical protein